jgi:hypothetical protein
MLQGVKMHTFETWQEELLATVVEHGECEFVGVNDANIPVNIFLSEGDNEWELTADNFMPRKCLASDGAYKAVAPTREALVEMIRKYVVPLYEIAVLNLQMMIENRNDSLYYWNRPKES